jgi:hypothetical protein
MTDKDLKLFNEISYAYLLENEGDGVKTKSPKYLKEKFTRRESGEIMYSALHPGLRRSVVSYCVLWGLPIYEWLDELKIERPS